MSKGDIIQIAELIIIIMIFCFTAGFQYGEHCQKKKDKRK